MQTLTPWKRQRKIWVIAAIFQIFNAADFFANLA